MVERTSPAVVGNLVAELAAAFPRERLAKATVDIYVRELADIPGPLLEQVVRELIRTSEFFPTVRAIRAAAAERQVALPGEAAALAQIEARVRWGRQAEHERGDPPPVHPLVREALEHVGGFQAFRSTDEPGVVRGQFLRLYRDLRGRAILDVQIGQPTLDAVPARLELGP